MSENKQSALRELVRFFGGRNEIELTSISGDRLIVNGEQIANELNALTRRLEAIKKLGQEAESHRVDYHTRSIDTEQPHYWKGRRDEAGHFRDKIYEILE